MTKTLGAMRTQDRSAKDALNGFMGTLPTPAGVLAVVLIAVQALWRGGAVWEGFFTQGDYVVLRRAADQSLDLDYLFGGHAGELSPVASLLIWLVTAAAPLDWRAAAASIVVLQGAAGFLMWLVLSRLLPGRWVRLPLLAVALFSPLSLAPSMWWTVGMMHLPTALLFVGAVLALLAHQQDDWKPGPAVAGVAGTLALLCSDHTLLLPVVLLTVVAGTGPSAERGMIGRFKTALRHHPRLWGWLSFGIAARVVLMVGTGDAASGAPSDDVVTTPAAEQFVRRGLTGLVGGPWTGETVDGVLAPGTTWPVLLATVVCLALVLPLLRGRDPVITVALVGFGAYVVGAMVQLQVEDRWVGAFSLTGRMLADLVPVTVVLLAVALRKIVLPVGLRRAVLTAPALTALALTALYVVSVEVTASKLLPAMQNTDDRKYVSNLSAGLDADPRIVLLDGPVPEGIMSPAFGKEARVSTVAYLLPQEPAFDVPSEFLRVVDGTGLAWAVDLREPVSSKPSKNRACGYPVRSRPTAVEMAGPVRDGERVMRIGYYINADTYAVAHIGDREIRFPVRNGLRAIDIPVEQGFDELTLTLESLDHTLCVTGVEVGVAIPAPLPGAK